VRCGALPGRRVIRAAAVAASHHCRPALADRCLQEEDRCLQEEDRSLREEGRSHREADRIPRAAIRSRRYPEAACHPAAEEAGAVKAAWPYRQESPRTGHNASPARNLIRAHGMDRIIPENSTQGLIDGGTEMVAVRTCRSAVSAPRGQQMVHGQLVQPLERHPARGGRLHVELLEGGTVGEERLQAVRGRGLCELVQA
jgi:hypothetical protein